MKCLTFDETQQWLGSFEIKIGEHRHLSLPHPQNRLIITFPGDPVRLYNFASKINEWLPQGVRQLIWMSNWETYPPGQFLLFEKVRSGCGEYRSLIDAPGHLFEPADFSDPEKSIANGIIFLILAFNWEAYLVSQNCEEVIYLGDECLAFFSADNERLEAASALTKSFGVKIITDIREAWNKA